MVLTKICFNFDNFLNIIFLKINQVYYINNKNFMKIIAQFPSDYVNYFFQKIIFKNYLKMLDKINLKIKIKLKRKNFVKLKIKFYYVKIIEIFMNRVILATKLIIKFFNAIF